MLAVPVHAVAGATIDIAPYQLQLAAPVHTVPEAAIDVTACQS
jgi:hypothetical protein